MGNTYTISLSNGSKSILDYEDYKLYSKYSWTYQRAKSNKEYARREKMVNGKRTVLLLHREILKASKGQEVDHINGDGLDNRKCNIRICTHEQNMQNRKIPKNNSSGFKGVRYIERLKKWRATAYKSNKEIHIGFYPSLLEAVSARSNAAKLMHGEYYRAN